MRRYTDQTVKVKLLHLSSLLMAVAGTVLSIADTMKEIAPLNPTLAHGCPLAYGGALALNAFGRLMGWTTPTPPSA